MIGSDSLSVDHLRTKAGELTVDTVRARVYRFPTVHLIRADNINGLIFVTGLDKGREIRRTACFCNR